jgi:hypothetical protein
VQPVGLAGAAGILDGIAGAIQVRLTQTHG